MIFAKVDVELRDHERAHQAGAAMATWAWALLWTRAKERDGFVAVEALRGSWVGERAAARDMARLVAVGLVEAVSGGWMLLGYAEKNDTHDDVELRKADQRRRKNEWTERKKAGPSRASGNALPTHSERVQERVGNFPEPEPEPEPEPDLRERESARSGVSSARSAVEPVDLAMPLPAWAGPQVESIRMSCGPAEINVALVWRGYVSHVAKLRNAGEVRPIDEAGWAAWLVREWKISAAGDRRGARSREVQRDPPGPKAYAVGDGRALLADQETKGGRA